MIAIYYLLSVAFYLDLFIWNLLLLAKLVPFTRFCTSRNVFLTFIASSKVAWAPKKQNLIQGVWEVGGQHFSKNSKTQKCLDYLKGEGGRKSFFFVPPLSKTLLLWNFFGPLALHNIIWTSPRETLLLYLVKLNSNKKINWCWPNQDQFISDVLTPGFCIWWRTTVPGIR